MKIKKKKNLDGSGGWVGGGGLGIRVDVYKELKFLGKFTQKKFGGGEEEVALL